MRLWLSLPSAVAIFAALTTCAAQQQNFPDIPEIATHAGIIFRGTVLAVVTETPRAPGEVAAKRVTFRVEEGIRGAAAGETLTIRQWNATADEYRVGEALLLFLYAPSNELGLTSPVGGRAGHRRVEEVSADVLNSLRTPRSLTATAPSSPDVPRRPARPARQGGNP